MAFKDNDFLKIDYSLWRVADNQLVRTTEKKLAEGNGIFREDIRYTPQLVVISRDNAIKALWEALKTMDVGESKTLDLEPKDAFGERNQSLVRMMPIADFRKRDIDPVPGMQIDIDGVIATVKSVNSGRVMVDANNPLAGEKVRYEIKVVSQLVKPEEKVRAVAEMYALEPHAVSVNQAEARVVFDSKTKMDADYFLNKTYFVGTVFEYLDEMKKVIVEEEHLKERPAAVEEHHHS
jgi:FKBP-type peptidyl-prolyl cis-trans isomerase 2